MKDTIRWGIIGAGKIARKFAADLMLVENATLAAIASRTQEHADIFGDEFQVPIRYASYDALVADPSIDVVYIATPHVFHFEHTMLCLSHGKAVLCEKPFAMNEEQVLAMIAKAKQQNVFLMEALWSAFLPHFLKLKELLSQQVIGEITAMQSNFGFKINEQASPRLYEKNLGGGTLLDIGIYNVFFVTEVMGLPDEIEASAVFNESGSDMQCDIHFNYDNGSVAHLFSTFKAHIPIEAQIFGTEGNIKLTQRFYEPSCDIMISRDGGKNYETVEVSERKGFGYQYEAQHVTDCLFQGLTESPVMTFYRSVELMKVLDAVRSGIGLSYPQDHKNFM
jgi:predicted dehydrogenase